MRLKILSVCFSNVYNSRNLMLFGNVLRNDCSFNLAKGHLGSEITFMPNHSILKCFRLYSIDSKKNDVKAILEKEALQKQKKPKEIKTYITLLGTDKNMYVTTVEEATKLATRRNYKLVKVKDFDQKTSRAVYQLMTESEYLKMDSEWKDPSEMKEPQQKKENFIKGNKVISLSSNISEHDTNFKVKLMKKWLSKRLEVRVVIAGDRQSGENVYRFIEKEIGNDGRILQKRSKAGDIRFQIIPPKNTEQKSSGS